VSRGARYFDVFRRGVAPVEAILVESRTLGLRIERSALFPSTEYRHDSACGSGRLKIGLPDLDSALVLCLSRFKRNSLRISCSPSAMSKVRFSSSLLAASFTS
jgi:hypothetical protein